jgi:hypothetical protein
MTAVTSASTLAAIAILLALVIAAQVADLDVGHDGSS